MAKTIKVFVNTGNEKNNQLVDIVEGSGDKGKPTRIKAIKGARYQLQDPANKDAGPETVRSKRVGKNLHVILEGGTDADLVIENYYEENKTADGSSGLYGTAEDGGLYEYIPEDPIEAGTVPNLKDGSPAVSQVLGGGVLASAFELSALPLVAAAGISPLAVAGGVAAAAAAAGGGGGGGGGGVTPVVIPSTPATPVATDNVGDVKGALANNATTDDRKPVFSGKGGTPDSIINIYDGNTVIATTTVKSDGTWSVQPTSPLVNGNHSFSSTASNSAGESAKSTPLAIVVDAAPIAPVTQLITDDIGEKTGELKSGDETDDTKPTFSGVGTTGDTVKLYDGSVLIGEAKVVDGKWSIAPTKELSAGTHSLTLTGSNTIGEGEKSTPVTLNVVAVGPASPRGVTVTDAVGDIKGEVQPNADTDDAKPVISGKGTPGMTVKVMDGDKEIGTAMVGEDGTWSVVPATPLSEGKHSITTFAVDATGKQSASTGAYVINVDTIPPAKPATPVAIDNVGQNAGAITPGSITDDVTPDFSGTGTPGDKIRVLDGTTLLGEVTVGTDGKWSFTPTKPLGAGAHSITLVEVDPAGNKSEPSSALTFTVDASAVAVAITKVVDNKGSITADVSNNGVTDDASPTLIGTATPNAVVTIKEGTTTLGTVQAGLDGSWSFTPSTAQSEGKHTYTAEVTNAVGTQTSSLTVTIDTTPPAVPTATVTDNVGNKQGTLIDGDSTDDTTPVFNGAGTPGDTVKLYDGAKVIGTTTVKPDGTWSIKPALALIEGTHALSVTATDPAGNESAKSSTTNIQVDTSAPNGGVAPDVRITTDTNDDGAVSAKELGTRTTFVVSASFDKAKVVAGDKLIITDGTTTKVVTLTQDDIANGFGTTTFAKPTEGGTLNVNATLQDAIGNVTPKGVDSAKLDTLAPNGGLAPKVEITTDNSPFDGFVNANELNGSSTFAVKASFDKTQVVAGDKVIFTDASTPSNKTTVTLSQDDITNGFATATFEAPAEGVKLTINAVVQDAAGNPSAVGSASATLDTTAPTTSVSINAISTDSGLADFITNDKDGLTIKATLSSALTTGEKLFYSNDNGTTWTDVTSSVSGTAVSFDDSKLKTTQTIKMRVVDAGNNTGPVASQLIKIDTTAPGQKEDGTDAAVSKPVVAIAEATNGVSKAELADGIQSEVTLPTGTVAGDKITLTVTDPSGDKRTVDYTVTAEDVAAGKANVTIPTTQVAEDGNYNITAVVTDIANNSSKPSEPVSFKLDTTAPGQKEDGTDAAVSKPVVAIAEATNGVSKTELADGIQSEVTLPTGTVAGDKITLTVTDPSGDKRTVDYTVTAEDVAAGKANVTIPTTQVSEDGNYSVSAVVTDIANNASKPSDAISFKLDTTAPGDNENGSQGAIAKPVVAIAEAVNGVSKAELADGIQSEVTLPTGTVAGDKITLTVIDPSGDKRTVDYTVTAEDVAAGKANVTIPTTQVAEDGNYNVSAVVTDIANNASKPSEPLSFKLDTTAPGQKEDGTDAAVSKPVVAIAEAVNGVSKAELADGIQSEVTLPTGTVAGDKITLTVTDPSGDKRTVDYTVTAEDVAAGKANVTIPTTQVAEDGNYNVTAVVTDIANNSSKPSEPVSFKLDTTAPGQKEDGTDAAVSKPVVAIAEAVNGVSKAELADGIQSEVTLPTGTVAGDKITLTVTDPSGDKRTVDYTVTAEDVAAGKANVTIPTTQVAEDGNYSVSAVVTDIANNASKPSDAISFKLDTAGPSPVVFPEDPLNPPAGKTSLVLDAVTADNVVNIEEAAGKVMVTGTARGEFTAGDEVTLTIKGNTYKGNLDSNGKFAIEVAGVDLVADSDVTINATLVAHDQASNTGTITATKAYSVDIAASTTTVSITAISNDTGVAGDFVTSDNDGLTITAKLSAALATGETLWYSNDNGVTWTNITAAVSGTGVTHVDAALTSTSTVKMRVDDAANNFGAVASQLITIDTTGPKPIVDPEDPLNPPAGKTSLVLDAVTADNVVNAAEGAADVAITGTARGDFTVGDDVTLMVNDVKYTGKLDSNGKFNISVKGTDLLADKNTTIDATLLAHDVAANTGTIVAIKSYTFDTVAPQTTVSIDAISLDTGLTNDFITSDNNGLIVSGKLSAALAAGEKLWYSNDNGGTWADITASVVDKAVTYTDAALTKTSTIKMRVGDSANNYGAAAQQLVTIDTSAPNDGVAPTVEIMTDANNDGFVNADELQGATTFTVKGSFDKTKVQMGDKLIFTNGSLEQSVTLGADEIAQGFAIADFAKPTAEGGSLTIKAKLQDLAMNTSLTAEDTAKLDTVLPTTTVKIDAISMDSGVANDFITNDSNGLTVSATLSANLSSGEKLWYSNDDGKTWQDITSSVKGVAISYDDATLKATHTIKMRVGDVAMNFSAEASKLVTIDTTAPVADALTNVTLFDDVGLVTGNITTTNPMTNTDDGKPTFSGKASSDVASVNIYDGAELLATVKVVNGSWSYTPDLTLKAGEHSFSATALDIANNESQATVAIKFVIASNQPGAPAIVGVLDDVGEVTGAIGQAPSGTNSTTDDTKPTISGTGTPGTTVKVYDGAKEIGSAVVGEDGSWSVTPVEALSEGEHKLTAKTVDAIGQLSVATGEYKIVVDTTAPDTPKVAVVGVDDQGQTKGEIAANSTTDDANPEFKGTGTAGDKIKVFDGTTLLGETKVDANGEWKFTPTAGLTNGVHSITYTESDAAGNKSGSSPELKFTVDTSAVKVAITKVTDDKGSVTSDVGNNGSTDDTTPTLVGTATANAVVTIKEGEKLLGTATADGTGNWSFTPVELQLEGKHTYTASVEVAGNTSTSEFVVNIDTTASAVPSATITDDVGTKQGVLVDQDSTDDTTPTLSGKGATPGDKINVYDGATLLGSTKVQEDGTWSFTPTSPLGEGSHAMSVSSVDPVGNESAKSTATTITVDTAAPKTTVTITGISEDTGVANDFITSDTNGLTVTANLSTNLVVGEKLWYSNNNGATWIDVTADVSGTSVRHVDGQLTSTNTVKFQVRDAAENAGLTASQLIKIDAAVPNGGKAPTVEITTDGNNDGIVEKDELGGASSFTVKGTFDKASVKVGDKFIFNDGTNDQAVTLLAGDITNGFVTTTFAKPNEGATLTVTGKVMSVAGVSTPISVSDSAILKLVNNTKATVDITSIDDAATNSEDTGSSATDFITNDSTLTFKGTVTGFDEGGSDRVKLELVDPNNVTVYQLGFVTPVNGSWKFVDPVGGSRADGTYKLIATIVDKDGHVLNTTAPVNGTNGGSDSQVIVVDTVPPNEGSAPSVLIESDRNDDGAINAHESSTSTMITVTAAFDRNFVSEGDIVIFSDGTNIKTRTVTDNDIKNGSSSTTFAKPAEGASLTVTAKIQDLAGNTTAISASDTAILDTTPPNGAAAPVVEITSDLNNDGSLNADEWAVSTSVSVKASFTKSLVAVGDQVLFDSGSTTKTVTLKQSDIDKGFVTTFFDRPANGGNLTVTAMMQDRYENGTASSTDEVKVDTVVPTTKVTIDSISEDTGVADFTTSDNNGLTIYATLSTALAAGEKLWYSNDNGTNWANISSSASGTAVSFADANLTSTTTVQFRVGDAANNFGAVTAKEIIITTADAPLMDSPVLFDTYMMNVATVLDLDAVSNPALKNVSTIQMQGNSTLTLSADDVLSLGNTPFVIDGTTSDSVKLDGLLQDPQNPGTWSDAGRVSYKGNVYEVFNHSSTQAQVLIDLDIISTQHLTHM